jgi:hypothetical protein
VYIRAFSIFVLFFVPCGFARRSLASSKQSAAEVAAHAYWFQLSIWRWTASKKSCRKLDIAGFADWNLQYVTRRCENVQGCLYKL